MSLNLGGLATLSSITLSRPGGDDGETLATLKLSIGTKDTEPVCAALGTEAGDALEWAWLASGDGQIRERRYLHMGAIACATKWKGKHSASVHGYKELRPELVAVESVTPMVDGYWEVALKVQIKHPPAGAVECWAQYIGDAIRVELMQDADLLEPSGDLKQSVERLRDLAKEDGTTVTISADAAIDNARGGK